MNTISRPKVDTKHNLILSALKLFAADGIDAVSMRTINSTAGARNASAVHYHFGNKLGIVEAIVRFIKEELDTYRLPELERLERSVEAGEPIECRSVMWAMFDPYYRLNATPEYGKPAVRFIARLQMDMSPEIQAMLDRDPHETTRRFDALLAHALPQLPADVRRTRYLYGWTLVVQGFASTGRLESTAFGDLRPAAGDTRIMRFFDYIVGGMEAPMHHG